MQREWLWVGVLGLAIGALPAQASSTGSSAASSASNVSGSVSDSLGGSSDSSKGKQQVVAGHYRIDGIEPAAGGRMLVRLMAQAEETPLNLRLPVAAVEAGQLRVGGLVEIQERPYGWALGRVGAEAFFLLLNDQRDLETRPL